MLTQISATETAEKETGASAGEEEEEGEEEEDDLIEIEIIDEIKSPEKDFKRWQMLWNLIRRCRTTGQNAVMKRLVRIHLDSKFMCLEN